MRVLLTSLSLSLFSSLWVYQKKNMVIINSLPSLPHKSSIKSNPCSKICHLLLFFVIAKLLLNKRMEMWREKHFYLLCQIIAYCLWIQGSLICLVRMSRSLWPISVTYALQTYLFVNDDKSMTQHTYFTQGRTIWYTCVYPVPYKYSRRFQRHKSCFYFSETLQFASEQCSCSTWENMSWIPGTHGKSAYCYCITDPCLAALVRCVYFTQALYNNLPTEILCWNQKQKQPGWFRCGFGNEQM